MVAYDLKGQTFGRLKVIRSYGLDKHNRKLWACECECGNTVVVNSSHLVSGHTKSCGCLQKDLVIKNNTTHGGTHDRLYVVWRNIKRRCENPKDNSYRFYGGKGVKVCNEWQDYSNFRKWAIQSGYDKNAKIYDCTIDRIDSEKDYSPDNCRWISIAEQQSNRKDTHHVELNGETYTFVQLSSICGIPAKILNQRIIHYKWPIEKAMNVPYKKRK